MANRLRRFIDSVVFAGLRPSGGPPAEAKPERRLGPLRDKIELFLSGGRAPSDPFYLTNRTWKQKGRLALLIATPTALLFCALALVLTNVYAPKAAPPREVSAVDLMAKLLPDIEKTVNIYAYKDAEIVELRVLRDGAPRVSGVLKNKTDHVISVECDIDLANVDGSRISTATERVEKAPALSSMPFEFPVHNPETAYALVRKMRTVQ